MIDIRQHNEARVPYIVLTEPRTMIAIRVPAAYPANVIENAKSALELMGEIAYEINSRRPDAPNAIDYVLLDSTRCDRLTRWIDGFGSVPGKSATILGVPVMRCSMYTPFMELVEIVR